MDQTLTDRSLDGKRALVTGGGSGIGAACARALAAAGALVTVADVNEQACLSLTHQIGGIPWVVDLTDTAALAVMSIDTDILVNNAGIQRVAPIEEFEPEAFHRILTLMLEVPFLLIRASLPGMYRRGFGRVINISSVHGMRASAYKSAYVAAKHGLEGLSKVTALEGASHGVTSNCINPGYVRTPLVERQVADQARVHGIAESEVLETVLLAETAVKRLVEPDEVAQLALYLTGPQASMITGSSHTIDGGWTAI